MKVKNGIMTFEEHEGEFKEELKRYLKEMCDFKMEDFPATIKMLGIKQPSYKVKFKETTPNAIVMKIKTKEEEYKVKFFKVQMIVTAYCASVQQKGYVVQTYEVGRENGVVYFRKL